LLEGALVLSEENESPEKELISLRGIGKALVSEKKLDEAIKEAKKIVIPWCRRCCT